MIRCESLERMHDRVKEAAKRVSCAMTLGEALLEMASLEQDVDRIFDNRKRLQHEE